MRRESAKISQLKAIVSNIIHKNDSLHEIIDNSCKIYQQKFIIKINADNNSLGSKVNGHIILGVGNLERLFDICNEFCKKFPLEICIDESVFNMISNNNISIETCELEETLDTIELLNDGRISPSKSLTICALAFTLYHEFGHVKYDDGFMSPIEKERRADIFALDIVKKKCAETPEIEIDQSPYFLGALLDTCLILNVCDPARTEVNTTHPHPIERLYLMLEYFHIESNSYLWQYVYDVMVNWINKHHIVMTFENDSSITLKDKLLDIYHRFKK